MSCGQTSSEQFSAGQDGCSSPARRPAPPPSGQTLPRTGKEHVSLSWKKICFQPDKNAFPCKFCLLVPLPHSRAMESKFSLSPESLAPSVIRHAGCARHLRNSETGCSVSSFTWDRTCLCTALDVRTAFTFYMGCSKHPQRRMLCVRAHVPRKPKMFMHSLALRRTSGRPRSNVHTRCSLQWATREPGRKRGP